MSSIVASDQVLSAGVKGRCTSQRTPRVERQRRRRAPRIGDERREAGLPRLAREVAVVDVLAGGRIEPRRAGDRRHPAR